MHPETYLPLHHVRELDLIEAAATPSSAPAAWETVAAATVSLVVRARAWSRALDDRVAGPECCAA